MPQFVNSLRGMWDPMRTTRPLALFLLLLSLSLTGFAQGGSPSAPLNPGPTAPIPSDPHEIATGETQVALAPSERSSVLALIERAREKSDLTFAGSAAFALDVSFDASSQTQSSAPSSGKTQETSLDPQHWQWTAQLGGYSQTRLFLDGKAYDKNVTSPLPLRLQMARDAIFWPAPRGWRLLVQPPPHLADARSHLRFDFWRSLAMPPGTMRVEWSGVSIPIGTPSDFFAGTRSLCGVRLRQRAEISRARASSPNHGL